MKKITPFILSAIGIFLVSCNNSGESSSGTTENADTSAPQPAAEAQPAPFEKEVSYGNMKFTVTTQGEADAHHFKLIPQGLTERNDTMYGELKGTVKDVIIDDIDGDNSPEIGVIESSGSDDEGTLHVYSTFNGKSIGMANYPDLPAGDKALQGYKGHDEYQFVENTLIRRFPLYDGDTKTEKMRQLQYKLKPGEAMKQLVLDKTVEF